MAIERDGEPEDFSNAVNIRLHFKNFDCIGEVKSFQIVDGNIVRVEVSPEWASNLGAYRLILSYEFEDLSYSDGDQKCVVDVLAFNIVPKTSEADDVTEMAKTTDIMIGLKGDKGDAFTYEDFTPEQIEDLKRPAIEAAESVLIVENQISLNEQGRVQAENERETAESLRVDAEIVREQQEQDRQTNTQTAITNAEDATENANTAAQNADDAREAIEGDLALKANHGYSSNPKTLKQVDDSLVQLAGDVSILRDDATVKIENLVVNGDFRDGTTGWERREGSSGNINGTPTIVTDSDGVVWGQIEITSGQPTRIASSTGYNLKNGDKIYISSIGKALLGDTLTEEDTPISFDTSWGGNYPTSLIVLTANQRASTVYQIPSDGIYYYYASKRAGSSPDVRFIMIRSPMIVNLTATFGEGNEPTKEEMDLLISTLGIDYFEGEITIPSQKIMQWQLAMIRQNRNAIIALGGTII